jgi:hypothetical protein
VWICIVHKLVGRTHTHGSLFELALWAGSWFCLLYWRWDRPDPTPCEWDGVGLEWNENKWQWA